MCTVRKRGKFVKRLRMLFKRNAGKTCATISVSGFICVLIMLVETLSQQPSLTLDYSLRAFTCDDGESIEVISQLCSAFEKKKITGNICDDLCQKGRLVFQKCINNRKKGKYALLVNCENSCIKGKTISAVLKMSHVNSSDLNEFFQSIDTHIFQRFSFIRVYDSKIHLLDRLVNQDSIVKAMTEQLDSEYGFQQEGEINLPRLLWNVDNKDLHDDSNEDAVSVSLVRSLWSLMAQSEYRISTVFRDWSLFPQIYGFCGPLYLSEYAPFDSRLDRRLPQKSPIKWRDRVSKAMQIFKLIQLAENLDNPVHFCDVKVPHFGMASDRSVRLIDADTVFTNKTLSRDLAAPQCKDHHDCAFFDCEGWCHQEHGRCSPVRTNNNLQVICAKILRNDESSIFEGLLSNPPSSKASQLRTLLDSCADDVVEYVDGIPMKTPGHNVLANIQDLLMESITGDDDDL